MSDAVLLHEVAALVDRHADALRRDADVLIRDTARCAWDGPGARRFPSDATPLLHRTIVLAARLVDGADVLRRHAG